MTPIFYTHILSVPSLSPQFCNLIMELTYLKIKITYSWKEGEGILFDETYLHFVHNDTPYHRIILFLDIKRPFETSLMAYINDFILYLIGISPHNQKVVKKILHPITKPIGL